MSATRHLIMPETNPEVAHLMNLLIKELRGHVVEKPICVKEAAEFLQVDVATVYRWIKKGIVQVHYMGSRPYFFPSELRDSIKNAK